MSARILIGDAVRVVRPAPGVPVNSEGHVGRVIDFADHGRAFAVEFIELGSTYWLPASCLEPLRPIPTYRHVADCGAVDALDRTELIERLLAPVPNPVPAPYVRGVRRG
jgi:hypothetical protein